MAENLLDMLKTQLSGPLLEQIAKLLGLDIGKTTAALGTTAATLLAGLTQKAAMPGGGDQILGLIRNQAPAGGAGAGGDILSHLPDILSSPEKRGEFEQKGTDIAGQILGPNLGAVLGALGGVLGLGKAVLTPLLGMLAPLLLNVISKQVLAKGLGAQGLTELLKGQVGFLKGALPPELTRSLGINSLADLGTGAAGAAGSAVKAAADGPSSFPNWLLPVLGLLALALLALLLWRSMTPTEEAPKADTTVNTPKKRGSLVPVPDTPATEIAEEVDIVETADKNGDFKQLIGLLKQAGLVDRLKGKGPFTVFAPTDEAFAKLPAETLADLTKPEKQAKLIEVLKLHVVEGDIPAAKAATLDGKEVLTLAGNMPITVQDGKVHVGGATVTKPDVKATNGVIHIIDMVLLPPN
jgi:uncharacterized surface protein with fasciclin (FAS1) repeats